ncbi:hypothetical protein M8J77_009995 [Diaphorina citri]|nr:hypothetical protein M8J77_009995 [Diaphorina citri]
MPTHLFHHAVCVLTKKAICLLSTGEGDCLSIVHKGILNRFWPYELLYSVSRKNNLTVALHMFAMAAPSFSKPIVREFKADHPFIYAIKYSPDNYFDINTNLIIFSGTVNKL